jgi:hypothetical protein
MALELARAVVAVRGDTSRVAGDIRGGQAGVTSAAQNMVGAVNAILATIGATISISAIISKLREAVPLAERQLKAEQRVAAVVRATGMAAGFTAEQLKEQSAALQEVTTVGDEEILELQAKLLTFRSITGDTFEETTELVLDLAESMQSDARSAAIQFGKALQDPIRGTTALGRAGVIFTDAQKEQIKVLVESGRLQEAQALVLAEIKTQVGGVAREMAKTPIGMLNQQRNILGDQKELLGKALIPLWTAMIKIQIRVQKVFNQIASVVLKVGKAIVDLNRRLGGTPAQIVLITAAVTALISSIQALRTAAILAGITIRGVLISTGIGAIVVAVGVAILGIIKFIKWLTSLDVIQKAIARNAEKFRLAWDIVREAFNKLGTAISRLLRKFFDAIPFLKELPDTISGLVALAIDKISDFVLNVAKLLGALVDNWQGTWELIKLSTTTALSIVMDVARNTFVSIPTLLGAAIKAMSTFIELWVDGSQSDFAFWLDIVGTSIKSMVTSFQRGFGFVAQIGGKTLEGLGQAFDVFIRDLSGLGDDIRNETRAVIDDTQEAFQDPFEGALDTFKKETEGIDLFKLSPETEEQIAAVRELFDELTSELGKQQTKKRAEDYLKRGRVPPVDKQPPAPPPAEPFEGGRVGFAEFGRNLQDQLLQQQDPMKQQVELQKETIQVLEDTKLVIKEGFQPANDSEGTILK